MTLQTQDIIYLACYLVSFIACYFLLYVIAKYHENKPLGMQTLLGKVIVLFTKVLAFTTTFMNGTYCLIELYGPYPRWLSKIWVFAELSCLMFFYLTLFSLTVTKYCLIYHSTIMAELSEEEFLKNIKTLVFIGPLILSSIEYTYFSAFDDLATFQLLNLGYSKNDSKPENVIVVLVFLNLAAATTLYTRIQYSAISVNDTHSGLLSKTILNLRKTSKKIAEYPEHDLPVGYNINVIRICLLLGFLVFLLLGFHQMGFGDVARWNILFMAIILTVICPLILVLKNKGMKDAALTIIKDLKFQLYQKRSCYA